MEAKEIKFKIWALKQDNLRRGDILERIQDEAYKAELRKQMKEAEEEIRKLEAALAEMEE